MEVLEVIPDPVSLIESMRAVGYTVEAAVADIIDNSIAAGARNVEVEYGAYDKPYVAILDDGEGMTSDELTDAMRHGSRNPNDKRKDRDLGRFGLGLKTASLSQCRKLTVISKKNSELHARIWDIDEVSIRKQWIVLAPNASTLDHPLLTKLAEMSSGTLVIWENLDRLIAFAKDLGAEITSKFSPLLEHLALVFHRFTDPAIKNKLRISVNGLPLPFRDPFLKENCYRQCLEGQAIQHQNGNINISPFILPPISHLSQDEITISGGEDGLRGTQGFYVYRGRRLVIWGTWFKLVPKSEFYKLTRIQVDIPNSLDELWALDIKKSTAHPPDFIRTRLRQLIPHFANASKKTIKFQGRTRSDAKTFPIWNRIETSLDHFRYEINREHPLILKLSEDLTSEAKIALSTFLTLTTQALPLESIYADMCADARPIDTAEDIQELVRIARILQKTLNISPEQVMQLDPFSIRPKLHETFIKELLK